MQFPRVRTPVHCIACRYPGEVYSSVRNNVNYYACRRCKEEWKKEFGDDFKIVNHEEGHGKFLGIFYGPWLAEERKTLEGFFRAVIYKRQSHQEWSFFKGRTIYTAWQMKSQILICRGVVEIMQKVNEQWSPARKL